MTREEVIRCFWYFSNVAGSGKNVVALTRRDKEAFDMAIEALSAEPCEDAISRQATVERLCKVAEFMNEKRDGLGSPYVMAALFIQDNKDEFPSVTPKQKMGRWIREKKHHKDGFQEFDYWDVRCSECGARKRIVWTNIRHCPMCGAKMSENLTGSNSEEESEDE